MSFVVGRVGIALCIEPPSYDLPGAVRGRIEDDAAGEVRNRKTRAVSDRERLDLAGQVPALCQADNAIRTGQ